MKCGKCGKDLPEILDYCPTCKINSVKENRENEKIADNEFKNISSSMNKTSDDSDLEEGIKTAKEIIKGYLSLMGKVMIVLWILWAIILFLSLSWR